MIKVHYAEDTGKILGFYPDFVRYPSIPEPNIVIDSETYRDCVRNPGGRIVDTISLEIVGCIPAPNLAEIKASKLSELYGAFCAARDAIVWVDDHGWDADADSQVDFLGARARAVSTGTSKYRVYTDRNDLTKKEFISIAAAEFDAALLAGGVQKEAAFEKFDALRSSIASIVADAAKTDTEKITAINFVSWS